jgi:hypothetical protein
MAIEKLSALGTGLGNLEAQRKITLDARKYTCETTAAKNESKDRSSPHSHFIEHLVCVSEEPPHESD